MEHMTALSHRLRPSGSTHHGAKSSTGAAEVNSKGEPKNFQLLTPLEDMSSEYTGIIGVGTTKDGKAQFEAQVVFDTGSTNLWVASVLCKDSPCDSASASKFYDPAKSVTQAPFLQNGMETDSDIDIVFGTGELKGPLHVDTYRVGPMAVEAQPFAMIRQMTGEVFATFPFEGRVIKAKLLKVNEFAFFLNTDSNRPSALLWGGVDKDLFEGPLVMFPVVKPHYWSLELVDIKIGGKSLQDQVPASSKAKYLLVDSGTTYFTAPTEMMDIISEKFPDASCSEVEKYPPLQYVLRSAYNKTYTLEVGQETYMVSNEHDVCTPAFMPLDIKKKSYGPAMILGEVFMRHFFTVFSRGDGSVDQARVGFARAKVGAEPKVKDGSDEASSEPSFFQMMQVNMMRRHDAPSPPKWPRRKLLR
eukprot:TRINITY_DN25922_c0_g1_i2.p1 TRINITY_DN25922_c0_g1~~TRINITY_DN25922_c0_g1_i2.p1  ORF type:complete len:486 (+),score=100.93 TRINITY_DN25922_c0_g1_i2:212-1459(+)